MKNHRLRNVLAGVILGAILGFGIYFLPANAIVAVATPGTMPEGVRLSLYKEAWWFGSLPGVLVGILVGLVLPPLGHMGKSIGAISYLPVTILAWTNHWDSARRLDVAGLFTAAFVTFITLVMVITIVGALGKYVERVRE